MLAEESAPPRRRWLADSGLIAAISVFVSFLSGSQTWAGFNSPDSEFYASLALFGSGVTDRALEPAYTWTRLGYIAPVRGLVTTLGPWVGFAAWRFVLITMIVAALYAIVRMRSTRELAAIIALLAGLNTVVLSYVGNTYLTGSVIAVTMVMLALGCWGSLGDPRRRWVPMILSGVMAGWLIMINPYGFMLGMSMWAGIRLIGLLQDGPGRWRRLCSDAVAGIAGVLAALALFLAAGAVIFPGRNWVGTYLEWNSKLDYASFVGSETVWHRDIALLVPVAALVIAAITLALRRGDRWATSAVVVSVASFSFTAVYLLLVPGPWLEAPTYIALLWSGALVSGGLAFASLVGTRRLGLPVWITPVLVVPLVIWSGHWDRSLSVPAGLAVFVVMIAAFALAALALGHDPTKLTAILVVAVLGILAVGAQILQDGRGPLGIYGQYPFRAAYVDFDNRLLMQSRISAEEFILAKTTATDRVGIWTDPISLTASIAAMQLWGWYNNISSSATMTPDEAAALAQSRPTAIAMYAPDRAQIYAFWSSLPPQAHAGPPQCTSVPYLGIGSPQAHVCMTHLSWDG
jgi:hypothetical protein